MVDIPISANASGVVDEFQRIAEAIARARGAAKDFSALDLSHGEISGLGAELQQLVKNFDDLNRIGSGPAAAGVRAITGRSTGQSASPEQNAEQFVKYLTEAERLYPDKASRDRNVGNVIKYVTRGTSAFSPVADADYQEPDATDDSESPGATPPRKKYPGGFRGHGMRLGGKLGSALGGEGAAGMGEMLGGLAGGLIPEIALPLLAIAGVSKIGSMASTGTRNAMGEAQSDDALLRSVGESVNSFNDLRDATRAASAGLMVTYQQMGDLGKTFAQASNNQRYQDDLNGARDATGFARALGLDPSATTAAFGATSLAGNISPKDFAELLADTIAKSGMTGQSGQVLQSLSAFAQNASRYLVSGGGQVRGAMDNYAALYGAMGATGQAGLMGSNADSILGTINSSLMGGGAAGNAGQVAIYQTFARAGIKDPYAVQMALQSGAFTPVDGAGGKDTYDLMQGYMDRIPKGNQRYYAMSQLYGISMPVARAMDSLKPGPGGATNLMSYLGGLGIGGNDVNAAAIPGIAQILNMKSESWTNSANGGDPLDAARTQLLGSKDLSTQDRNAITGAKSFDDMQAAVIKALNDQGLPQDEASKLAQSQVDVQNALTKACTDLLVPLIGINNSLATLLSPGSWLAPGPDTHPGMTAHPSGKGVVFTPTNGGRLTVIPKSLDPDIAKYISSGASAIGLDPARMLALATMEGGGDKTHANISSEGAVGIMQLMPNTAAGLGVNPLDWRQNVNGGLAYFAGLYGKYKNYDEAEAAYNWGPGNLDKDLAKNGQNWLANAPMETQNYVAGINALRVQIAPVTIVVKHPNGTTSTHKVPVTAKPPAPHNAPRQFVPVANMAPQDGSA